MKCISVLRYLTDHVDLLPLGVVTRLTVTQDAPVILSQLLQAKPWLKKDKVFQGSEWVPDDGSDLAKIEGQTWIALYNMLSKKSFTDKYQLHHYRLEVLAKLSGQINEATIQQLPILEKLKEWLLRMSLVKPQAEAAKDLVLIEAVAEIRQSLEDRYLKRIEDIAAQQKTTFLNEEFAKWQSEAGGKLLETLETEAARSLMNAQNDKKSTVCGQCRNPEAGQRCSRCKNVRYCSRECQAKDWPRHRPRCIVK